MNLIDITDMSFSYENNRILENISLNINKGDYVGIIGANGTGKSTLLKLILGLLSPEVGNIIRQEDNIGYVPQVGLTIKSDFPATVEEVVLLSLCSRIGLFRRTKKKHMDLVDHILEIVGMNDYKHQLIGKLSGGQQQKVLIAKALINEPSMLILDEPNAGIDEASQRKLYELLKNLNKEQGITIVMVTHSVDSVALDMNKIFELKENRLFARMGKELVGTERNIQV
jgi:zinc transport system ATP-binding protein